MMLLKCWSAKSAVTSASLKKQQIIEYIGMVRSSHCRHAAFQWAFKIPSLTTWSSIVSKEGFRFVVEAICCRFSWKGNVHLCLLSCIQTRQRLHLSRLDQVLLEGVPCFGARPQDSMCTVQYWELSRLKAACRIQRHQDLFKRHPFIDDGSGYISQAAMQHCYPPQQSAKIVM